MDTLKCISVGGFYSRKMTFIPPPLIDGQAGSNTSRGASWLEGDRFLYIVILTFLQRETCESAARNVN